MIKNPVLLSNGSKDITKRCRIAGVIDSPEDSRKRIFLMDRDDVNLKIIAGTVSNTDKTWEIITGPVQENGKMTIMSFDDSDTYNAQVYDRVSLDDKVFAYSGSTLQAISEQDIVLHRVLLGINRVIRKSFCNWLTAWVPENVMGDARILKILPPAMGTGIKSFVLDIADNWGDVNYLEVRAIEFYTPLGNLIDVDSVGFTAYATTQYNGDYVPANAFSLLKSKTGDSRYNGWYAATYQELNQRLICVFDAAVDIGFFVINNGHRTGGETDRGAKTIKATLSTDAIVSTVYDEAVANSVVCYDGVIRAHIASNVIDDNRIFGDGDGVVSICGNDLLSIDFDLVANSRIKGGSVISLIDGGSYKIFDIADGVVSLIGTPATMFPAPIKSVLNQTVDESGIAYAGIESVETIFPGVHGNLPALIGDTISSIAVLDTKEQVLSGESAVLTYSITVDSSQVDEGLTDFPLAVALTDADLFSTLGEDKTGFKIEVAGVECPVEIESWDAANNKAFIHVKVPTISATEDTVLTLTCLGSANVMYVGESGSVTAQSVWDENFAAVYHMAQDPSTGGACILDSTSNENHGTPVGSMTSEDSVDGEFGKIIEFDGIDDYINAGDIPSFTEGFTWHFIIESTGAAYGISDKGSDTGDREFRLRKHNATEMEILLGNGVWTEVLYPAITLPTDTPYDLSVTWDASVVNVFLNGALEATISNVTGPLTDRGCSVTLGSDLSADKFTGSLGSVALSSIARSAAWIKTTNSALKNTLNTIEKTSTATVATANSFTFTADSTNIDEDLTDFPVMVNLSESSGTDGFDTSAIFNELSDNNLKLSVKAGDVECPVEIEHWDSVNKKAILWVKVPLISSTMDTILTLTYDAALEDNDLYVGETGSTAGQSVWDSNFKAVYHMAQDPSIGGACILDSTSNANHGTPNGSMTSDDLVDGDFGKALEFDGINDFIQLPRLFLTDTATMSFMQNPKITATDRGLVLSSLDSMSGGYGAGALSGYTSLELREESADGGGYYTSGITIDLATGWYAIAAIFDNGFAHFGVNDIFSDVAAFDLWDDLYRIAYANTSKTRTFFSGSLREIRLSSVARSDPWIKATNLSNTDSIFTASVTAITVSNQILCKISPTLVDSDLTDFPVMINLSAESGTSALDLSGIFNELGDNNLKFKIETLNVVGTTAKSVVFDVADNWGYVGAIGAKSIEFYRRGQLIELIPGTDYVADATSDTTATLLAQNAFNTALSKTGSSSETCWQSQTTNPVRCSISFTTAIVFDSIVINNYANSGGSTSVGIKTVKVYTSTDEITSVVFEEVISNSILIFDGQIAEHVALDVADDQELTLNDDFVDLVGCPVEIEHWDSVNKKAILWVKIPTVSATTNTVLTLTYDATLADNTAYVGVTGSAAAQSVWDSNFKAVYHMAQDPSIGGACILDSTSNANHGTPNGSMTSDDLVDGDFGKALEFDGINDFVLLPEFGCIDSVSDYTLDIALKTLELGDVSIFNPSVLEKRKLETQGDRAICLSIDENGYFTAGTRDSVNQVENSVNAGRISNNGVFNMFSITNDASESTYGIYDLGAIADSIINSEAISADAGITIGCRRLDAGEVTAFFAGQVATLKISNIIRSAAWIKATNLSNTDSFIEFTEVVAANATYITPAIISYSMSFDNKSTYKAWTGTEWRAIASKDDSVHGVTDDAEWYFRDGADVWSKTDIENTAAGAINKAATFELNQMTMETVNTLTTTEFDTTGGFLTAVGYFDIASTFQSSQAFAGGTVSSVIINDEAKQVYFTDPINLDIGKAITGSSMGWSYKKDAGFDFDTNVEIYVFVTGEAAWVECTQASAIPGITSGMTTTEKMLYFKVVSTTLDSEATLDPALLTLDITIL